MNTYLSVQVEQEQDTLNGDTTETPTATAVPEQSGTR